MKTLAAFLVLSSVAWGQTVIFDAGAGMGGFVSIHREGHHGVVDLTTGEFPAGSLGTGIFSVIFDDESFAVCEFVPEPTESIGAYYGLGKHIDPLRYVYFVKGYPLEAKKHYRWSYRCGPDPDVPQVEPVALEDKPIVWPVVVRVQITLTSAQAKYPGNEKAKPCGPDNHDSVCVDSSLRDIVEHIYSRGQDWCEVNEKVPCIHISEGWAPIGKPVFYDETPK